MSRRGELHEMLEETVRDPVARAWLLDRLVTPNEVGRATMRMVRPRLDEMSADILAEHLIGGVAIDMPDFARVG